MVTKLRKKAEEGFTLIELMVALAIVGILAAVAIPAFMQYMRKSKTTEAKQFVRKIYEGARSYYMEHRGGRGITGSTTEAQFPENYPGWNPAIDCCQVAGQEKCMPNAADWTHPTWKALKFSIDDPHYFVYNYDGRRNKEMFRAQAQGNLDCDDERSYFEMVGEVRDDGTVSGSANIWSQRELE